MVLVVLHNVFYIVILFCTVLTCVTKKTFLVDLSLNCAMTLPFFPFLLSLDSLRCHPEDQKPDPDVVPPESTLKTLMYDSFLSVTIYLCFASDKPAAF